MIYNKSCTITKALLLTILVGLLPSFAWATESPELIPKEAGVEEHRDKRIDLSLRFKNRAGESHSLGELIRPNRPFIIVPVYFRCPRLCTLTLNSLLEALREQNLQVGQDFSILTVSFAAGEGSELAAAKAQAYHSSYLDQPGELGDALSQKDLDAGWKFLTGDEKSVEKLMSQLGFQYIEDNGEYSHSSAMMLLTSDGKISNYIYGFPIKGKDLRLGLVDASKGIIGSAFDRVLLYCFRFDPTKGQYTLAILKLFQVVGMLTLISLVSGLIFLRLQETG